MHLLGAQNRNGSDKYVQPSSVAAVMQRWRSCGERGSEIQRRNRYRGVRRLTWPMLFDTDEAEARAHDIAARVRRLTWPMLFDTDEAEARAYDIAALLYDIAALRLDDSSAELNFPRAEYGIKEGKAEAPPDWFLATAAPHHATGNHINEHDDHAVDGTPMNTFCHGTVVTDTEDYSCSAGFTVAASAKGGTEINIGSHVMLAPKYLSVHHPLAQMLLFASYRFGDTFACLKSAAPKSIFDMAKGLCSSASPIVCGSVWISARPKSDSPKLRTDSEFNTGESFGSRNELAENESHPRGIDSCSKDGYLRATQKCVHMMNGDEGTTDQPRYDVYIIDSGAALHCTGDRNLLSEYTDRDQPDGSITGASGTVMPIHGVGSICNGRFQVKDVKYIPSLNRPNINKTIFSVFELGKLGYSVHFDGPSCSVVDNRNWTWSWKTLYWTREVVGEGHLDGKVYMMDYLRIPTDRTRATSSERPTLAASIWKAASSGLSSMTEKAVARRPPV